MFELDQLSPSVRSLKPSATLKINEESNQLIAQGKSVIKLGLGQSPFPVPEIVVESLQAAAREKDYLPVKGLQPLRATVADYYRGRTGLGFSSDSVLIGPGSKELLFNLQMACQSDLLIPAPSWVSYAPQAQLLGRQVTYLPVSAENRWQIQPDQLDQYCQSNPSKTRLLILNYPSNPTGCGYDAASFKQLAVVARKHKLIIVADEIYAETSFSGQFQSLAEFYPEGTVISSGLSKWCGAGGWRLGLMVFPDELRPLQDAMAVIASETFTSISAPTQYAAITAFTPSSAIDAYLEASRKVLKVISDYMVSRLRDCRLEMEAPEGGFYLFVSFQKWRAMLSRKGIETDETLCARILDETGIAMLPGSDFGMTADQLYTRMAYVDFDGARALSAIGAGISDNFMDEYCPKLVRACDVLSEWLGNK
ncbi:pyridoxal phosphate-dependent aminotransferase [Endozoicomonas numazuensis]|uniref:Aminotransferase n=1 Tax=Endozoicomonas numazuensis TaxID=1137799 RepID=A0A081NKK2_9GAMM|nr:aminotransferase class I/II-fold pyridoxal phosphate-dependent enzyme [Endozoicomonas numazuensis]KEQ18975.1 aspartate aminotransferase [Endozoicomonas numazuensis]